MWGVTFNANILNKYCVAIVCNIPVTEVK